MNEAITTGAFLAAFLALFGIAFFWLGAATASGAHLVPRVGLLSALFSAAIIGLALWWQVPTEAQRRVEAAASFPIASPQDLDCAEIEASAPLLENSTGGAIAISPGGELIVSSDVWRQLASEQRSYLTAFANRARECMRGSRSGAILIRDPATGAEVERIILR